MNGKELARAMEDFINGADHTEIEDFANEFTKMHNTLEQRAVGMLIKTLVKVSEHAYTDGRNEACVKAAKLMLKGYKKEMVQDLVDFDNYWTEAKASELVNKLWNDLDFSKMPLI